MPKSDLFLSLTIPAYNEETRIQAGFPDVIRFLENHFYKWEIVCVDDGSIDGTHQKLLEIQTGNQNVRILRHDRNQGKGKSVRTGFSASQGDLLLFSDADFSAPIDELPKLLDSLHKGFDIAIGSRALPDSEILIHQSKLRESIGKAGNFLIQSMLYLNIKDTQCGFKLFKKVAAMQLLPRLTIDGFAFDVEMLAVATLLGLRIAEVPVTWRNVENSRVLPIHSLQVLRDVFQIRYNSGMGKYY